MAKYCDICETKIKFKGFRCKDGIVCKKCYGIVSNHYTDIIAKKTISELKGIYSVNTQPIEIGQDGFETTQKVGTFFLMDNNSKKFCILGNPTVNKKYNRPEVYGFGELEGYRLSSDPELSPEELVELKEDKKNGRIIKNLKIQIRIKEKDIKDVFIISTPVRSSSYAFRKSYSLAMDMMRKLDEIYEENQKRSGADESTCNE